MNDWVQSQAYWTQLPCLFTTPTPLTPWHTPSTFIYCKIRKTKQNKYSGQRWRAFPIPVSHPTTKQLDPLSMPFSSDYVSHCHRVRSVDTLISIQHPSQASYLRKWELGYLRRVRDTCLQCLNAKGAKDRMLTPGNFVCWPVTLVNAKCHWGLSVLANGAGKNVKFNWNLQVLLHFLPDKLLSFCQWMQIWIFIIWHIVRRKVLKIPK